MKFINLVSSTPYGFNRVDHLTVRSSHKTHVEYVTTSPYKKQIKVLLV